MEVPVALGSHENNARLVINAYPLGIFAKITAIIIEGSSFTLKLKNNKCFNLMNESLTSYNRMKLLPLIFLMKLQSLSLTSPKGIYKGIYSIGC